jgi:hypothetical protein
MYVSCQAAAEVNRLQSSKARLAAVSTKIVLQDRIRAQHRELLRIARRVHPVPKVVEYLALGITSKSSRTRVETTEALCEILAEEGLSIFERMHEKPFPAVAQVCKVAGCLLRCMALQRFDRVV